MKKKEIGRKIVLKRDGTIFSFLSQEETDIGTNLTLSLSLTHTWAIITSYWHISGSLVTSFIQVEITFSLSLTISLTQTHILPQYILPSNEKVSYNTLSLYFLVSLPPLPLLLPPLSVWKLHTIFPHKCLQCRPVIIQGLHNAFLGTY